MLNQRRRKYEIANELDKTQSTIAREINRDVMVVGKTMSNPVNIIENR